MITTMRARKVMSQAVIFILLTIISLTTVFPFIWMLSTSFKFNSRVFTSPIEWLPNPATLQNYVHVWTRIPFLKYYKNTVIVTLFATVGQLFISSMAAYAFAKIRFFGRNFIFMMFLATMMIPWHTIMVPQYILMQKFKLIDTLAVLILGQLASGFGIFLLRQFFMSVPNELRESAMIDGMNEFGIFLYIILPQAKPGIAALAIFSFIHVWNDYLAPLIYLNSESKFTIQIGLKFFQSEHTMNYSATMAGTMSALIPILLLYFILEKQITKGIVFTGIKG
jgi:multiple sugar transport system permease protein